MVSEDKWSEGNNEAIVPDLVGLSVDTAMTVGFDAGVLVIGDNPEVLLADPTLPGEWIVVSQQPMPGTKVERGDTVLIEIVNLGGGNGGESGDREPRVPTPPSGSLEAELDEPELFDPTGPDFFVPAEPSDKH